MEFGDCTEKVLSTQTKSAISLVIHQTLDNGKMRKPTEREDLNDDTTLTMSVPGAGAILGLTRNGAYQAAKDGLIPTVKFGRLIKVPKKALRQKLQEAGLL
jgi:hypothetical protein